jgi:hypothetical protein
MTEGTKYHALFEHLLFSGQGRQILTFGEIEAIIETPLPASARRRPEWWSNSPSGHSQARAWMRAGYKTSNINLVDKTVLFTLDGWPEGFSKSGVRQLQMIDAGGIAETPQAPYTRQMENNASNETNDHPLFGIWRDEVKLLPDFDYTKPAFTGDLET